MQRIGVVRMPPHLLNVKVRPRQLETDIPRSFERVPVIARGVNLADASSASPTAGPSDVGCREQDSSITQLNNAPRELTVIIGLMRQYDPHLGGGSVREILGSSAEG